MAFTKCHSERRTGILVFFFLLHGSQLSRWGLPGQVSADMLEIVQKRESKVDDATGTM